MFKIILIIIALIYVFSPYDIFPDFMIGWGWLDDLIVLGLLGRYLYSQKRNQYFFKNRFQKNESEPKDRFEEHRAEWDSYRILGVDRSATPKEIKAAYRQLANTYHPDKVSHLGDEFRALAEERFKEIQRAYQDLGLK